MKHWNISYGKDGFCLHAYESRRIGLFLEWLIDQDPCWWGEYKNLPFCLINPWGWTFKIGPEDKTLGDAWLSFGNWCHWYAWKMQKTQQLFEAALTDEQAEKIDPEFFADMNEFRDNE